MADESKSFFQTLPGILTTTATVVTAITGLIIALNQAGFFHNSESAPVATTAPQPSAGAAPPMVQASVTNGQQTAPVPTNGSATNATGGEALTGVWLNTLIDPHNGRPDSRLIIRRRSDGTLTLQGWGNCGPMDCDWGLAPLEVVTGGSGSDLSGLRATTKLVHVVPDKNVAEITYLTLRGTGAANTLAVKRRFESYNNGQLGTRIEKSLTFAKQARGTQQ
jgi:hypothetical protein